MYLIVQTGGIWQEICMGNIDTWEQVQTNTQPYDNQS